MRQTTTPKRDLSRSLFLLQNYAYKLTAIMGTAALAAVTLSCSPDKHDTKKESVSGNELAQVMKSVAYGPELQALSQGASNPITNPDSVLVISRTQDSGVSTTELRKLSQAFMAKSTNPLHKVTPEDLTGSTTESLQGGAAAGGMQAVASGQQTMQFALSQGIPAVLTVSIETMQVKETSTVGGVFMGTARGTISLISCIDGTRLYTADASENLRGIDRHQVTDNLVDKLASGLASRSNSWSMPQNTGANTATCEVHARIEGLNMPSFQEKDGVYVFADQKIPIYAAGASVELDGVLVGQTPCLITTGRGMRKLKVQRPGMEPFEAVVNLSGKNRHDVILTPSRETLVQYNDQLAFLRGLQHEQELTRATVSVMEGYAKMLRQSGYRVDMREIKDSKQLSTHGEKP